MTEVLYVGRRTIRRTAALGSMFVICIVPTVFGQVVSEVRSDPDTTRVATVDILATPSEAMLRSRIAEARTSDRESGRKLETAKSAEEHAKGEIRILKRDEDAVKARIDLAKDDDRAEERQQYERQREDLIFERKFIERMRDVYDADGKAAEGRRDASQSAVLALEAELQLMDQRRRVVDLGHEPSRDQDFLKAQRQVLELQRESARKSQNAAAREETLIGKRLDALKHLEEGVRP